MTIPLGIFLAMLALALPAIGCFIDGKTLGKK